MVEAQNGHLKEKENDAKYFFFKSLKSKLMKILQRTAFLIFSIFLFSACKKQKEDTPPSIHSTPSEVLDWFEGIHTVVGTRYCWAIPELWPVTPCDTVFTTELELIKEEGESLHVNEPISNLNQFLPQESQNNDENIFKYYFEQGAFSSKLTLNIETDSIFLTYCPCANGFGTKWTFKGKRE